MLVCPNCFRKVVGMVKISKAGDRYDYGNAKLVYYNCPNCEKKVIPKNLTSIQILRELNDLREMKEHGRCEPRRKNIQKALV